MFPAASQCVAAGRPGLSTLEPVHRGAGDDPEAVDRAWLALYASHALSTWGQRMWEFAVGLLMLQLRPGSLLLVSVFGLVDGGAQVLAGGTVGSYVGRRAAELACGFACSS